MPIGDRIKYYREQAGMTMDQLAKAVGVQNSAINKYEKGLVTNIPINRIRQIADALGIDPRLLLDFLDDSTCGPVYLDGEESAWLEDLRNDPELRMLLSSAKKLDKEDIHQLRILSDRMNRE